MKCNICPRKCDIQRNEYKKGYCNVSKKLMVARAALHNWEEPCISGDNGSGTVFFSGCNLKCVFCQNDKISNGEIGKGITIDRLSDIFLELQKKGAHNINLVTPSHYVSLIKEAIILSRDKNLRIPIIYNSSAYDSVESLVSLKGLIDVYLPDLKYFDSGLSKRYSNASDYFEIAREAIAEMVRQQPKVIFDCNGVIKNGVIIRHMLLPGQVNDSKKILKYLHEQYGNNIFISIMSQYTPHGNLSRYPEIDRKVDASEYEELVDYAIEIGIENGFIQEGDVADESFIPNFNLEGV